MVHSMLWAIHKIFVNCEELAATGQILSSMPPALFVVGMFDAYQQEFRISGRNFQVIKCYVLTAWHSRPYLGFQIFMNYCVGSYCFVIYKMSRNIPISWSCA